MSYKGKITTTGTSQAIRLDKDLFKQHPEFKQLAEVKADIIGPGRMLISVIDNQKDATADETDPIVDAFLSFIEKDMITHSQDTKPLDEALIARAKALTAGISVSDDELD